MRQLYWKDATGQQGLIAWLALSGWVLGWACTIHSFSGSTWQADWSEHFNRAKFFLEQGDLHTKFLGYYSLAARPPLANVVAAVLLSFTGAKYFIFQAICAFLASLIIWPVLLLQRSFTAPERPLKLGWTLLLLMSLPAFLQNATFTWTKLPTTFFILVGLALLWRRSPTNPSRVAGWLTLSAGMLTHYSTAPWIIAIGLAILVRNPAELRWVWSRTGILTALGCTALLATWVGWSVQELGADETFGSNTTVTNSEGLTVAERLGNVWDNLYYTTVPAYVRKLDYGGYRAPYAEGRLRDYYFDAVQTTLPFIAGAAGLLVAVLLLIRARRTWIPGDTRFWITCLSIAIFVGIAVHSTVIEQGIAHICLVPLAFLAIAWLAAHCPLSKLLRRILVCGIVIDLALGIVLHYGIQSLWVGRWLHPGEPTSELINQLGFGAQINWTDQQELGLHFLYDLPTSTSAAPILLLASVMLLLEIAQNVFADQTGA